jgi:hypothetical protein
VGRCEVSECTAVLAKALTPGGCQLWWGPRPPSRLWCGNRQTHDPTPTSNKVNAPLNIMHLMDAHVLRVPHIPGSSLHFILRVDI